VIIDADNGRLIGPPDSSTVFVFGIGALLEPADPEYQKVRVHLLNNHKAVLHLNVLRHELETGLEMSVPAGWHYRKYLLEMLEGTKAKFQIWFDGYGDDPREIWEIDEIKVFSAMFLMGMGWIGDKTIRTKQPYGMLNVSIDTETTMKPITDRLATYKDFLRLCQGIENLRGKESRKPQRVGTMFNYDDRFVANWTSVWNDLRPDDPQPMPDFGNPSSVEGLMESLQDSTWGLGKTKDT